MDRFNWFRFFGSGYLTSKWGVEHKFSKLIFPIFHNFRPFLPNFFSLAGPLVCSILKNRQKWWPKIEGKWKISLAKFAFNPIMNWNRTEKLKSVNRSITSYIGRGCNYFFCFARMTCFLWMSMFNSNFFTCVFQFSNWEKNLCLIVLD